MTKRTKIESRLAIGKHLDLHMSGTRNEFERRTRRKERWHKKPVRDMAPTSTAFIKIAVTFCQRVVATMSHVMGDIPIKLTKERQSTKDEDDQKFLTQQLEQMYDDTKRKGDVPLFYGGDAKAMIPTIREFREVAEDLEFTEAQEKFKNFPKCLRDVARDEWDTAKAEQPETLTGFEATMYQ